MLQPNLDTESIALRALTVNHARRRRWAQCFARCVTNDSSMPHVGSYATYSIQ